MEFIFGSRPLYGAAVSCEERPSGDPLSDRPFADSISPKEIHDADRIRDHAFDCSCPFVADSGAGIPPEEISRVFEPFYRSEQGRRHGVPGVGLGLAIVERIATAFGGTTSLRSVVGVGSRCEVHPPLAFPAGVPTAGALAVAGGRRPVAINSDGRESSRR